MNYDIHVQDDIKFVMPSLKKFLVKNDLDDYSYDYFINGELASDTSELSDRGQHKQAPESISNNGRSQCGQW